MTKAASENFIEQTLELDTPIDTQIDTRNIKA